MNATQRYYKTYALAIKPRPLRAVSEWADAERVLTSESSKLVGRWHTDANPLLREPMDCLSAHSAVKEVVLLFPSQAGKTEVGLNFLGYCMTDHPGPVLLVLPSLDHRRDFVMQRVDPMLKATPALRRITDALAVRDATNSLESKSFPGGLLMMKGANAPRSIAGKPVRYLWMDETSGFPASAGKEGNPIKIARVRTSTFADVCKILETSTPTIEGACHITDSYNQTDMCRPWVPCPHCGEFQTLEWENLRWDNALTQAWYQCAHCETRIDESAKPDLFKRHQWRPANPAITHKRGFRANSLYGTPGLSPSWLDLVHEWLDAQTSVENLMVFWNTRLAKAWKPQNKVEPHDLQKRADAYRLRVIPAPNGIVTAGVDVQDDRLEVQLVAWIGHRLRGAVVDYHVIAGDPSRAETWERLTDYLDTPLVTEDGVITFVRLAAIDSGGHHTQEVYDYVRRKPTAHCGLLAVKGSSRGARQIIGKPSYQDINRNGKTIKRGVALYNVGTETAKHWIYHRLAEDAQAKPNERRILFSHELPGSYYDGLTAEVFNPRKNLFVPIGNRANEPLDTFVYALAAAHHPSLALNKRETAFWEALMQDRAGVVVKAASVSQTPVDSEVPDAMKPIIRPRRRSNSWVNR